MTLSDQIRQHPGKSALLVAQIVGCSVKRVHSVRWHDANVGSGAYRQRIRRNHRAFVTRHGVEPGAQKSAMNPVLTSEVIRLRAGGLSQSQVAKALGLTIGQVAGTMHLYRKRIEKGATGGDAR